MQLLQQQEQEQPHMAQQQQDVLAPLEDARVVLSAALDAGDVPCSSGVCVALE